MCNYVLKQLVFYQVMYVSTYCSERFGSRTIASEENFPPTQKLTLTQTLTLTGRGANCPDTERFVNKRFEK